MREKQDGSAQEPLRPRDLISPSWEAAADNIAYDSTSFPPPITFICGPANSGKSTFSRLLLNTLLNRYKRVAYLDTDVGQPEFGITGCVSLHIIDKQTPGMCVFFGHVSAKKEAKTYFSSIIFLYDYFRREFYQKDEIDNPCKILLPLIINTSGWVKGTGYDVLVAMLQHTSPTHVVKVRVSSENENLPNGLFWLENTQRKSVNLIQICAGNETSYPPREGNGEIIEEKGGRYRERRGSREHGESGVGWERKRGADFERRRGDFEEGFGYERRRKSLMIEAPPLWERGNYGGIRENDVEIMEEMLKKLMEMQFKTSLAGPIAKPNQELTRIRKLMEMQFKTPLAGPIAKPNQELTRIPLAESKGREFRRSSMREDQECLPREMNFLNHKEFCDKLASVPLNGIPLSSVQVKQNDCQVVSSVVSQGLNASIVGLAVKSSVLAENNSPPWCVGLGIIKAVDPSKDQLHLLTPVHPSTLKKVDLVIQSTIDIPLCLQQVLGCKYPDNVLQKQQLEE
ncbi:hypothetical protein M5K25_007907 [Dendrobium thyrsiflorum]|uniref:Polynucleotide 5'-hydroxyl-kinase NOL9 n=1 Tax=Dendrobium thyrsiflorum TaxID=117978 RepID=A0ABD0VE25_DENTH